MSERETREIRLWEMERALSVRYPDVRCEALGATWKVGEVQRIEFQGPQALLLRYGLATPDVFRDHDGRRRRLLDGCGTEIRGFGPCDETRLASVWHTHHLDDRLLPKWAERDATRIIRRLQRARANGN